MDKVLKESLADSRIHDRYITGQVGNAKNKQREREGEKKDELVQFACLNKYK